MDDMISRQAAIDAMMKLQAEDIEAYGASIPEGFDGDRAVTAIKALPSATDTNVGGNLIDREAALDALDKVAEMFPYRIPGKAKTYRQYNEAWSDAIDAAENALEALPSAQLAQDLPNTCTDAIGRQAAIETVRKAQSIGQAHRMLVQLPSAQPNFDEWCDDCKEYDKERHSCPRWNRVIRQTLDDVGQSRWIPCKTRKPEKSGLYLVTKQQKTGEIQLATAHYNTAFDEWSGNGNFKKVLAWQPLPSPWRGGQDG